jgi:hypothetical protein
MHTLLVLGIVTRHGKRAQGEALKMIREMRRRAF